MRKEIGKITKIFEKLDNPNDWGLDCKMWNTTGGWKGWPPIGMIQFSSKLILEGDSESTHKTLIAFVIVKIVQDTEERIR